MVISALTHKPNLAMFCGIALIAALDNWGFEGAVIILSIANQFAHYERLRGHFWKSGFVKVANRLKIS